LQALRWPQPRRHIIRDRNQSLSSLRHETIYFAGTTILDFCNSLKCVHNSIQLWLRSNKNESFFFILLLLYVFLLAHMLLIHRSFYE